MVYSLQTKYMAIAQYIPFVCEVAFVSTFVPLFVACYSQMVLQAYYEYTMNLNS